LIFGTVVFAVHSWSVRGFLFNLPSFLLKLSVLEIASILCYHLAFALFESVLVGATLVLVAAVLPSSWFRGGFVYRGFLLIVAATAAAIFLQYSFAYGELQLERPGAPWVLPALGAGFVLFVMLYALSPRFARLQKALEFLAEQISVMLYVYLPLDIVALLVVTARLIR
jgi:hypothetical protein